MKKITTFILLIFTSIGVNAEETKSWEEILKPYVEKTLQLAEKTGQFVIDQAPDVLQQFFLWHIWHDIFTMIIPVVSVILTIFISKLLLSKEKTHNDETKFFGKYGEEGAVLVWIIFVVIIAFTIPIFFYSLNDLVKILVAPKIYLIEYFIS